jgi:hypothetical protein
LTRYLSRNLEAGPSRPRSDRLFEHPQLVKGPARGDHVQIPIEYDEGLGHGVDNRLCEDMPILAMANHVVDQGEIAR